jgi:hypothetical protein
MHLEKPPERLPHRSKAGIARASARVSHSGGLLHPLVLLVLAHPDNDLARRGQPVFAPGRILQSKNPPAEDSAMTPAKQGDTRSMRQGDGAGVMMLLAAALIMFLILLPAASAAGLGL